MKNKSYIGISFIILLFGIYAIPRIVTRIKNGTTVQNDRMTFDLLRPIGTQFGDDFLASEVNRSRWGSATLRFDGCDRAELQWQALDPSYGSGTLRAQRLTTPLTVWPCRAGLSGLTD